MTDYSRIHYQLQGRTHTFWAKAKDVDIQDNGSLVATNVETGTVKYISPSTTFVLTEGVDLPADVRQNAEENQRIQVSD